MLELQKCSLTTVQFSILLSTSENVNAVDVF